MELEKILADRKSKYGRFRTHAEITQHIKQVIPGDMDQMFAEALDMIAHKMGRIINGDPTHVDSWVDIAGYAQLVVNELKNEPKNLF